MDVCVFVSFPHVSEDDQQSLILARLWPHPRARSQANTKRKGGNFVDYDYLKLHYISHKIK